MKFKNYRQYYMASKKEQEKIARNYPEIKPRSGIYLFYRYVGYIGKSSERDGILGRVAAHCLQHKQHIDNSIHNRKLTCDGGQWNVKALAYCEPSQVDELERAFIKEYYEKGYELYNIESGGTAGKEDIAKRSERGGYNKGKEYGYKKAISEISVFFEKYLDAKVKKDNAICRKKFNEFLIKIKMEDKQ